MIAIIDYGMANLRSVQKAFESVGANAVITSDPHTIANADRIVLPGVGAFRDAIGRLNETGSVQSGSVLSGSERESLSRPGLNEVILRFIETGRPFLGICLGMQMLFSKSYEDGEHQGLNLFAGRIVRFDQKITSAPGKLKIPHMGWNSLTFTQKGCPLFRHLAGDGREFVYFVHGYYAEPEQKNIVSATADYPTPFCAAIWKDNVVATQFHPEKSQRIGLTMLKNFSEM